MGDNKKIMDVYKSRNILLEILKRRNYETENYDEFSINEIHTLYNNKQLDMLFENTNNKVYVKYFVDKMIRPNNIYEIIEDLFNYEQILIDKDELIIVIKDEPNETLEKLQNTIYQQDNIYINIINIDRLQFNPLKHILVPFHRILSQEEKEEIIKKYNIVNDNIPTISRFDPISQVIGIRPGQYCEITRPSKTSITSKFYRICSN